MDQAGNGAKRAGLAKELEEALGSLQDSMALVDLFNKPRRGRDSDLELLLKEHRLLRIRMDGNQNHTRPHIHIDYHRQRHLASYAIDDGTLLAGDKKYNRVIQPWIEKNRELLTKVWEDIRSSGGPDDGIVVQLLGSEI